MDSLLLKILPQKPTLDDLVKPNLDRKSEMVFRATFKGAKKDQNRILKKARSTK